MIGQSRAEQPGDKFSPVYWEKIVDILAAPPDRLLYFGTEARGGAEGFRLVLNVGYSTLKLQKSFWILITLLIKLLYPQRIFLFISDSVDLRIWGRLRKVRESDAAGEMYSKQHLALLQQPG